MSDAVTAPSDSRDGVTPEDRRTVTASNGRRLCYAEYGSPTGAPVMCFHGSPGSRVLGELFDGPARERDVRLLVIDRPGYGRSDPWPDRTLGDTGEFVTPVLDDAGVSVAGVVGFSGGGPHALALAATRPDVVTSVDVVSGSPPPALTDTASRTQRTLECFARFAPRLMKTLVRGQARLAERTSPALVVSQYTSGDGRKRVGDRAADVVRRDFVESMSRTCEGFVTESLLLAEAWGFSPADVDVPVRLRHGAADANAPIHGVKRLADELPNSRLSVIDGADHLNALLESRGAVLDEYAEVAARE